jgi:hypothetical protein
MLCYSPKDESGEQYTALVMMEWGKFYRKDSWAGIYVSLMYTYTYVHIYVWIYKCIFTCTCVLMYTYAYTYIYIYIYTYDCGGNFTGRIFGHVIMS